MSNGKLVEQFHSWKAVIAIIFVAGVIYAGLTQSVKGSAQNISDHEERLRTIEAVIPAINEKLKTLDDIKNYIYQK